MDHLEHLRGTYDISKSRLERCRDILIASAQLHVPDNYEELISISDTNEIEHSLEWVTVTDPTGSNSEMELKIIPVLDICRADKATGEPGGLYSITLFGELPNGDEQAIGSIFTREGSDSSGITLKGIGQIGWDSADTEIFLKLADSVFQAQTPEI